MKVFGLDSVLFKIKMHVDCLLEDQSLFEAAVLFVWSCMCVALVLSCFVHSGLEFCFLWPCSGAQCRFPNSEGLDRPSKITALEPLEGA